MKTRKISLLVGLFSLVLAMLACTINIGGPDYPEPRIPVSTEAFSDFQSAMQTAAASGEETGEITLTLTETQLTSYLANRLQSESDPFITDPQVYLRNGQIQIYGMAHQGYLEATIAIDVTVGVDQEGQLTIELTSVDFGPLPVPQGLKDIVAGTIRELYTGAVGPVATGLRLESVTVADGNMTITGRTK